MPPPQLPLCSVPFRALARRNFAISFRNRGTAPLTTLQHMTPPARAVGQGAGTHCQDLAGSYGVAAQWRHRGRPAHCDDHRGKGALMLCGSGTAAWWAAVLPWSSRLPSDVMNLVRSPSVPEQRRSCCRVLPRGRVLQRQAPPRPWLCCSLVRPTHVPRLTRWARSRATAAASTAAASTAARRPLLPLHPPAYTPQPWPAPAASLSDLPLALLTYILDLVPPGLAPMLVCKSWCQAALEAPGWWRHTGALPALRFAPCIHGAWVDCAAALCEAEVLHAPPHQPATRRSASPFQPVPSSLPLPEPMQRWAPF